MVIAILIMAVLLVFGGALVLLTTHDRKTTAHSEQSTKSFYVADAGIEYTLFRLAESWTTFSVSGQYMANAPGTFDAAVSTTALSNVLQVTTRGYYPDSTKAIATRGIYARIASDLPSQVFDYSYFINNWGWYWGHDITSAGDVRSNGRFDFVDGPKVDGHIYAHLDIDDHGTPIRGTGGQADHQHEGVAKVEMPNLQDLSYYETKAIASSGTITINGSTIISGIYGDDAGETGNIVLVGTSSNPIEINETVVIRGDLVIKGKVEGQGTIYVGRNAYIADNIDYKNAPSSPRPASENPSVVDNWVQANKDKAFLAIAAKENIIMGDYTKTSGSDRWYANLWLFSMGSEDVGQDGIPDTGDTGEDDGIFTPVYEDLDGDGVMDDDYNWADVQTQADITTFGNLPGGVTSFSDLASNSINKIEGLYYTNHAFAGRTGNAMQFNGSIVSKDEAIIYRNNITFNYDERANSRYNTDPNRFVDLGLPSTQRIQIIEWREID
ncbi:MAG: hypothetical protein V1653_02765 [bacterium]